MAKSITAVMTICPCLAALVTSSGMMVTPSQTRCNGGHAHTAPNDDVLTIAGRRRNMGAHPYTAGQLHDAYPGRNGQHLSFL